MPDERPDRAHRTFDAWLFGLTAGGLFLGAMVALFRLPAPGARDGASPDSSRKTLVTAEECYKSTSGGSVYASLTQLSYMPPPYVDTVLGGGKKTGYCFRLTVGNPADGDWSAKAAPVTVAKTGCRRFFVDSSGVIRFAIGPANKSWGLAGLKILVTAEAQYRSLEKPGTYASLSQLSATTPPYVDSDLGAGRKGGYCFVLTVGTPPDSKWRATASPVDAGPAGGRFFCADESGIVRFRDGAPATPADPPADEAGEPPIE